MFYSLTIPINELLASIPPKVLWICFGVFAVIVGIVSLMLIYHWDKYKDYSPAVKKIKIIYLVGLAVLLVLCVGNLVLIF